MATKFPNYDPALISKPVTDSRGLVTGYTGFNGKPAVDYVKPPAPVYNPVTNRYDMTTPGEPKWDPTAGLFMVNGQPFTGTHNGETYTQGLSSQQIANSPSRYKALDVVKNPAVASATDSLLASFKPTTGITDFTDLLDASRIGKSLITSGAQKEQAALDTSGLEATLKSLNDRLAATNSDLNNRYSGILANTAAGENAAVDQAYASIPQQFQPLQDLNTRFVNTGNALDTRYGELLKQLQDNEAGIVQRANDLLPQYDTAANNIGDAQTAELIKQLSRYKLGTGTPMSLGSGEEQALLRGVANVRLPLEQQKIQRRYDLLTGLELPIAQGDTARSIGQIQNFSLPLAQQIYGQNYGTQVAQNSRYNDVLQNLQLPVLQGQGQRQLGQLTGFTAPIAQQAYQNDYQTANLIKNLQLQTAGMSVDNAVKFLRAMAVPDQLIQSILQGNQALQGGDISNLGALNNLYGGSRYQGLQDVLGTNVAQPVNYSFTAPGTVAPAPSRYTPAYANSTPTVTPALNPVEQATQLAIQRAKQDAQTQRYYSTPSSPSTSVNPAIQNLIDQINGTGLGLSLN